MRRQSTSAKNGQRRRTTWGAWCIRSTMRSFYVAAKADTTTFLVWRSRCARWPNVTDWPRVLARADIYGGWAEAMSSSLERGADRFRQGFDLQQRIGTYDNMSIHVDMQAEILQLLGRPSEAAALVDRAIVLGRNSGQWFWLSELYRRRAELRRVLGEPPARVASDLRRAIRTAEAQGAKWLAARCYASVAHPLGRGEHSGGVDFGLRKTSLLCFKTGSRHLSSQGLQSAE